MWQVYAMPQIFSSTFGERSVFAGVTGAARKDRIYHMLTFQGGIHPNDAKEATNSKPIEIIAPGEKLYFPLQQHIGAPITPLVQVGDKVKMGQKIADSQSFMSVPLHSSVSGEVVDIGLYLYPTGLKMPTIVINNDGRDTLADTIVPKPDPDKLTAKQILDIIREAGIVGMGGAGFPTHVKLSPPPEKKIKYVIINGAECEPYLTSDHRVMLETPDEVLYGLTVVKHLFGLTDAFIAIEENKPDAIRTMSQHAKNYNGIHVISLKKKYPQGAEKQLINALTGLEVPSGGLPADIGCVVLNIDTTAAIARAITQGMPLIRRIVTVAGGAVKNPSNFSVRIGMPFREVIEKAGGLTEEPKKIIMGGPMMGIAGYSLDVPVVKGTSGILAFTEQQVRVNPESNCLRCGRCVSVCPMHLEPVQINAYAGIRDYEACEKFDVLDCIECGCCSYVCPAKRHLVQSMRVAKQQVQIRRAKEKAKEKQRAAQ